MKNKRDNLAKKIGKELVGSECTSFAMGVKWADYNPNWIERSEKMPSYDENKTLYLCQILINEFREYRYSYRVGFIMSDGTWNIENENVKVMRYMHIYCNNKLEQLQKDIKEVYE